MAGYSGTPLVRKLGIKDGHRVLWAGAPEGFEATLGELPGGATLARSARGDARFDVIHVFATRKAELEAAFAKLRPRLVENGGLWVSWPKKTAGVATDLTENVVREVGLATGLVDNKVCAVDEVWSGLRFVVRVKDRKG